MTEAPSFTCPRCGATSYNPSDIKHRYCGRCHMFVDDAVAAPAAEEPADAGLYPIDLDEMIREVRSECARRRVSFNRAVTQHAMNARQADRRIAVMDKVRQTLEGLRK
jgi:ribosomal protein S27AE